MCFRAKLHRSRPSTDHVPAAISSENSESFSGLGLGTSRTSRGPARLIGAMYA